MAKRFTDSAKWDKVWFRKLKPIHKCLWIYICDRCDHAGIWEVDLETASYFIGEELVIAEILTSFEKQFIELNSGSRWLIKDFLIFQYGQFDESNKMFKPIQSSLTKNGVSMGDIWGINPLKVKDKVMVKVKETIKPTIEEVTTYFKEKGTKIDPISFHAYYEARNWVGIKKWKACLTTWEQRHKASVTSSGSIAVSVGKRPAELIVVEMRILKWDDLRLKNHLLEQGYTEKECDEALGKKY